MAVSEIQPGCLMGTSQQRGVGKFMGNADGQRVRNWPSLLRRRRRRGLCPYLPCTSSKSTSNLVRGSSITGAILSEHRSRSLCTPFLRMRGLTEHGMHQARNTRNLASRRSGCSLENFQIVECMGELYAVIPMGLREYLLMSLRNRRTLTRLCLTMPTLNCASCRCSS